MQKRVKCHFSASVVCTIIFYSCATFLQTQRTEVHFLAHMKFWTQIFANVLYFDKRCKQLVLKIPGFTWKVLWSVKVIFSYYIYIYIKFFFCRDNGQSQTLGHFNPLNGILNPALSEGVLCNHLSAWSVRWSLSVFKFSETVH